VAEWPEPEADPEERQRWWGRVALVGAAGAALVLMTTQENQSGSWRLPEFSLPTLSLPDFDIPEVALADLRGRTASDVANAPDAQTDPMSAMLGEPPTDGSPLVRPASFQACIGTIDGSAQTFGPPALIEDTPDRRVARFKLLDGQLTVTCADGMMTIEQYGG